MRHRCQHRRHRRGDRGPPGALARQPHQRRAITIIGLEPPRPDLRPRRLRLRRREEPQRARPTTLQLARERPMQRPCRLHREHRIAAADQAREPLDPSPRVRHRDRLHRPTRARDRPATPDATTLPGSTATTNRSPSSSLSNPGTRHLLKQRRTRKGPPPKPGAGLNSTRCLVIYQRHGEQTVGPGVKSRSVVLRLGARGADLTPGCRSADGEYVRCPDCAEAGLDRGS